MGRSQLQLAAVLPLALVPCFGMALGALWRASLARFEPAWSWLGVAVVASFVLGLTRLVGENVANLLLLILVVAAMAALAARFAYGRGAVAAAGLLVAAGLAHWIFLAVFAVVLAGVVVLGGPEALRARRAGGRLAETEAGVVAVTGGAAGLALLAAIWGVLRAPLQTFEIHEDPARFLPKLRADLRRLAWPVLGPVAAIGAAGLALDRGSGTAGPEPVSARRFGLHLLVAWTAVAGAGIAFGAATNALPPHRFLALLVAVPGAVALCEAAELAARGARRWGRPAAVSVAVVAAAALAVPGALSWQHDAPEVWLSPAGLAQAGAAGAYLSAHAPGRPAVFVVSPHGPAGAISGPLAERTIRVALPPSMQASAFVLVGRLADALAGRRTVVPDAAVQANIDPSWEAVRPVLGRSPVLLVLRAFDRPDVAAATSLGGVEVAPGVVALHGPPARVALPRPPVAVPRTATALAWGAELFVLLLVAGLGWTWALLGFEAPAAVIVGIAPAAGIAGVMVAGLVVAKAGFALAGPGGVVSFLLAAATGLVAALVRLVRAGRRAG
jgi:hypothetical protein